MLWSIGSTGSERRFDALEQRFDQFEQYVHERFDRLDAKLTVQIDGIDKRLDAIENLPRRVTALESAVTRV